MCNSNKKKIFIVEGCQGAGKTTLTRILREKLTYTVLISLTGTSDKTLEGERKSYIEHYMALQMMDNCKDCDINFVLDRSFLSERAYCMCGYKDFTFDGYYKMLSNYLHHIADDYDVYLILLIASEEELPERLKRDKPQFLDVQFKVENSMRQQEIYRDLIKGIKRKHPNINCIEINTVGQDPYDIAYDLIEGSK